MSHHLDSPLARQDVRLDITDLYVFRGKLGTVFVLNVNSSISGTDAPQGFHPDAHYTIKIDADGDALEDLAYRLTFGVRDATGQQTIELRRLSGRDAYDPLATETILAQEMTNAAIAGVGGMRLWAGLAGEPFYIDPTVLKAVGTAFKQGQRVDLGNWQPGKATNLFAQTNIHAIVLEVPDEELIWRLHPSKRIHVWGTTMLATDAGGWQPINRAGRPMIQPIFHPDESAEASAYNTTLPADDRANYAHRFAHAVARVVTAYGATEEAAAGYGAAVAALLLPDVLPYQVGTAAWYGLAGQNGRALTDNAPEVMFSLVTNSALVSGLASDSMTGTLRDSFPYVAPPVD